MKFLEHIAINPEVNLIKGEIYPFIDMASLSTHSREPNYISEKVWGTGVKFQQGDTVIARIEPCLQNGKRFYCKNIDKGFGSTEYLVFRPKDETVNSAFLYYFMQQDVIRQKMIKSMSGATGRQRVNNAIFNELEISLPPLATQQKIASILSAYDDLIENNRRQIKLLEEATQRLYKEWFVNLKFPGHENVKIIDGVPKGWRIVSITDLIKIKYGKDHKNLLSGTIPVYGSGGILRKVKSIIYSGESILIPRKGSLNNILYVKGDFWTIDTMFYSVPIIPNILKYVYLNLIRRDMYLYNIGAAVPSMTTKILDDMNILLPTKELRESFESLISPLFEQWIHLMKQNEFATEARDRLLSKLLSGEIRV